MPKKIYLNIKFRKTPTLILARSLCMPKAKAMIIIATNTSTMRKQIVRNKRSLIVLQYKLLAKSI